MLFQLAGPFTCGGSFLVLIAEQNGHLLRSSSGKKFFACGSCSCVRKVSTSIPCVLNSKTAHENHTNHFGAPGWYGADKSSAARNGSKFYKDFQSIVSEHYVQPDGVEWGCARSKAVGRRRLTDSLWCDTMSRFCLTGKALHGCLDQSQRSPAGTLGGMLAARCAAGMKPF